MQVVPYYEVPELYELLKENRKYSKRQVEFLHIEVLQRYNVKTVLDPACGTGNPSIGLALRGYHVYCSDSSAKMMIQLKKNCVEEDARLNFIEPGVEWAELKNCMKKKFDAVVLTGNSFYHLKSNESKRVALENFYGLMRKGGVCFIDYLDWDKEFKRVGQDEYENFGDRIYMDKTVNIFKIYRHFGRKQVDTYFIVAKENNVSKEVLSSFQAIGWAFTTEEIFGLAKSVGFSGLYHLKRPGEHYVLNAMAAVK